MALSKQASPDTLIWLGVGHTADLSRTSDETQVVLVDANPSALKTLEKHHCTQGGTQGNLIFAPVCLAPQTGEAEFYHYNLSEYSALSEVTGLRQLFPGIKLKTTQTLTTTAVTDFIRSQSLNTQNNTLRIDIIDQCLPLLRALAQDGLLGLFNLLELQTSTESLYRNAATTSDIVQFLSERGYELQTQGNSDPDFPTLGFALNPLWQTVQNAKRQLVEQKEKAEQTQADQAKVLTEKNAMLEELAKAIADKNAKLEEQAKALAKKDAKLAEANKVASEAVKQLEVSKVEKVEQAKALADKNAKLEEQAKALAGKDAKLAEANKVALEAAKQLEVIKVEKVEQAKALADKNTKLEKQAKALAEKDTKLAEVNKVASEVAKQLEVIKVKKVEQAKALADKNSKLEEQAKALAEKEAKLAEAKKAMSEAAKQLEVVKTEKADQAKVLAEKETKLVEANKQRDEQEAVKEKQTVALTEVQTQYKTLQTQNRQLQSQIKHNGAQLEQLKAELLKAEAQITLFCDLFFKNNPFQSPKGQ